MERKNTDVIILGAGLAGLTLAYRFKKHGIKALVLESRDRIGGRIHTIIKDKTTLELGATWFADKHINLLDLLNELGLEKVEQEYGKYGVYELANNEKQLFELPPQPEATYRLKGGTYKLIHALNKSLEQEQLMLNQRVQSISFNGEVFNIFTNDTSYKSQYLISTLPLNLMANQIEFTPALPQNLTNLARQTHTWMGESIKVGFFSTSPFWLEKEIGTVYSQKGPITELYDHSNEHGYALKGFIHDSFMSLPKNEREKAVRAQLTNLFGEENISSGTYVDTAWRDEKETYQNYQKPVAPHQNNGNPALRELLFSNKMLLAGSETAPTFPGYMDGAVEAANIAADKFIKQMVSGVVS